MARHLPPLTAFQAFEAAARLMSFTKAAAELHVTKSAISHHIRTLEDYLGIKLFHRSTRQLTLTKPGQACFPELKQGFDRLEMALKQLTQLDIQDSLKINASLSFAEKWLMPRLEQFEKLYPDLDIQIDTALDVDNLKRDQADVLIRYGSSQYPGLHVYPLPSEPIFPVVSPSLLSDAKALQSTQDLRGYRLIHVKEQQHDEVYPHWPSWLKAAGVTDIDATRGLHCSQMSLAIQAAIQGRGVALVRSVMVEDDLAAGRLIKLFDVDYPDVGAARCIVTTEARAKLPYVKAFCDWVLEQTAVSKQRPKTIDSTIHIQSSSLLPLQDFVKHSPARIALLDGNLRYIAASRKWVERVATGRCNDQIFSPDSQDIRDAVLRGLTGVIQHFDERKFAADGSARRTRWIVLPYSNESDEIVGVLVFLDDGAPVTILEARRRRYDYFGSESRDMIAFVDESYTYRAVNQAFLEAYGTTREDVLGKTIAQIDGEKTFTKTLKPILDRCLRGERISLHHWQEYPHWGRRYVHAHFDPIPKENGSTAGVALDIRDVTTVHADSVKQRYRTDVSGRMVANDDRP